MNEVKAVIVGLEAMLEASKRMLLPPGSPRPIAVLEAAIKQLKAEQPEPVQEPVACANGCSKFFRYTTPPAQTAVPLTVDEVNSLMAHDYTTATMPGRAGFIAGFRAAEVAYGITAAPKNGGAA